MSACVNSVFMNRLLDLAMADQRVPDLNGSLSSPDQSPGMSQKSQLGSREFKSPIKMQHGEVRRFKSSPSHSPTTSPRILGIRSSPSASESDDDDENRLLVMAKRRKLNYETPNYTPSSHGSPMNLSQDDSFLNEKTLNMPQLDGLLSQFTNSTDTSAMSTPAISPSASISSFQALVNQKGGLNFRGRYKKDELWPAIQGDYQFLMDEEIIETCKVSRVSFCYYLHQQ